jgi:hypothetical protein
VLNQYKKAGYTTATALEICPSYMPLMKSMTSISGIDNVFSTAFCSLPRLTNNRVHCCSPLRRRNFNKPHPHDQKKSMNAPGYKTCFGTKHSHQLMMEYIKQFVAARRGDRPTFVWSNFFTGHEQTMLKPATMDRDLMELLQFLVLPKNSRTVVVLLADHGETSFITKRGEGRMQMASPHLFVLTPSELLKENPDIEEALMDNRHTLISNYDIYRTLQHVKDIHKTGSTPPKATSPGLSMFQRMPKTRSCKTARVPSQYCFCGSKRKILEWSFNDQFKNRKKKV